MGPGPVEVAAGGHAGLSRAEGVVLSFISQEQNGLHRAVEGHVLPALGAGHGVTAQDMSVGWLLRGRAGGVGTCGWLCPVCWGPRRLLGGPAHALCLRTVEPGSQAPGAFLCLFSDACWLSLLTTAAWLLCSETSLMSPFSGGLWFGETGLVSSGLMH